MTSEPPAEATQSKPSGTASAEPPAKPPVEVEYDDFGLPIRKRRPRTPVEDSSDSEEEKFEDAVASKPASREHLALPKEEKDSGEHVAQLEKESKEETKELVKEEAKDQDNAQQTVNGIVNKSGEASPEPQKETKEPEGVEEHIPETPQQSEPTKKDAAPEPPVQPDESNEKSEQVKEPDPEQVESAQQPEVAKKDVPVQQTSKHHHKPSNVSISEYSHQHVLVKPKEKAVEEEEGEWQTMPAYARYDMYDDDNRLIAKENEEELEDMSGYGNVGGAAKGYTRVDLDDDANSQTSMDDNTAYLFKEKSTALADEDGEVRDAQTQMQTTKSLLTEGQRVAYVGLVRLASLELERKFSRIERKKNVKKILDMQVETNKMWSQKIMVRLYAHMEITTSEQIMIEQLSDHGVVPADLSPALMTIIPVKDFPDTPGIYTPPAFSPHSKSTPEGQNIMSPTAFEAAPLKSHDDLLSPPPYEQYPGSEDYPAKSPSQFSSRSRNQDIDLRWTVLCDLFLVLIADSTYDARSRELFEVVGKYLSVDWLEICRFEKRVTDALEMQEQADKENWNEDDHMTNRAKRARNKRLAFMGLATVGGGLVIGLSAGLLAPLIGAGLAAGFTTIGVAGTSSFLAGAGGAAIITSTGVVTGSTVGVRAMNRRTGTVKTFEYRPLHNNKRTHLIITLAGWMNGKVDDVRLPYSTVDPIMGDIYSVLWEPEMLRSMGDTINILATEALTQGLQQVLGSTILTALMAAMTLPLALTKLSYLIDNPWIVSQARADMAGLILADSLIDRNLGTRPVTLVGFSLGSRVIYSCLKELSRRGAFGVVQNVYMFGTPAVAKHDEYIKARAIVPGRFVNGYATNDWILGYLFRATSGGVMRVAGLAPVNVPTIENVNVTELVPGHMAYRAAMPKLLREVGWIVESEEFSEIEDPDPENHEKRQRELINEIEEARKEFEKKQAEKEKKGLKLSWWKKKKVDKKDWEVYDEHSLAPKPIDPNADPAKIAENPVMFDIDAIRKEVAALAAESNEYNAPAEFEIKEIKSTLPPMKIDISSSPATSPRPNVRETKSYNDTLSQVTTPEIKRASGHMPSINGSSQKSSGGYEEYNEFDDIADAGPIEMTFDSSFRGPPSSAVRSPISAFDPSPERSPSPWRSPNLNNNDDSLRPWDSTPSKPSPAMGYNSNERLSPLPAAADRSAPKSPSTDPYPAAPSPLNGTGAGAANVSPGYNAWANEFEDDFGQEKEVKMSFM